MSRKRLNPKPHTLNPRIYLDYAATAPINPAVLKVIQKAEREVWGNASSIHAEGVLAKKALDSARRSVALSLSAHADEIVFTSGGTESNNLAIFGVVRHLAEEGKKFSDMHIVTTAIEHSSVLEPMRELERQGASVTYVTPRKNGIVHPEDVIKAITPNTVLVSIQYANNEIGTIQPILKIAKELRNFEKKHDSRFMIHESAKLAKPILHVDASQAPLYLDCSPNRLGADLVTLDGHKMCGPKGIGMLYVRRGTKISPILFGGGQEEGIRSTTENVPAIVGFAKALLLAKDNREGESKRLTAIRDYAFAQIKKHIPTALINGDEKERLPNNINISIPGINAEFTVLKLDAAGISCSTKSSCVAGSEMSYVVYAMSKDKARALSTLRFTLGLGTKKGDVLKLIKSLQGISRV